MLGIEISMDIHVGQVWESIKVRKHYVVKGRAGNKYILWGKSRIDVRLLQGTFLPSMNDSLYRTTTNNAVSSCKGCQVSC